MTVKHKCPDCRCTFSPSRALDFEPELDTWLTTALIPTTDDRLLYTDEIFTAYAAWRSGQPRLSQSRLTRHLRASGYKFLHYGSRNRLVGYRLAS